MTPTDDFAVFYDSVFCAPGRPATTAWTPPAPSGGTARALSSPPAPGRAPLRRAGTAPLPLLARPGQDALAGYLQEARRVLATRPPEAEGGLLPGLSADFEALR